MSREPAWLLDFTRNVNSQAGEDGIIEKILETMPARNGWCVEFGAWDGVFLSNTRNLIQNHGYQAVLIEGSAKKFRELCENYKYNEKVYPLHGFVGFNTDDNLDTMLATTLIPEDFDFLCIDVDGNDYHIWKAMSRYRPKAVCIEFNQTIPTDVRFVQRADRSVNHGCSLLSLVELGKEKGYELVAVLQFNAFFVDRQYFPLFEIADNSPHTLRKDLSCVTYLFTGYDGTVFLQGFGKLPWHRLPLGETRLQPLPKFLRRFPGHYNALQKAAFEVIRFAASPRRSLKKTLKKVRRRGP